MRLQFQTFLTPILHTLPIKPKIKQLKPFFFIKHFIWLFIRVWFTIQIMFFFFFFCCFSICCMFLTQILLYL